MTYNTSDYAGNYPSILPITCILNEGAPTIVTSYDQLGQSQKTLTWASELYEGNYVAITNDTAVTYDACKGIPCVEKPVNGETLVIGKIVGTPRLVKFPANDAAANTLAERIAGRYYRIANVEILGGITKLEDATVMADGSNACVPGVGTTLKYNITSGDDAGAGLQLDSVESGGEGVIPFHYAPAGTDGDTTTVLVGITAPLVAVTGA
jgi:hypothetical protein